MNAGTTHRCRSELIAEDRLGITTLTNQNGFRVIERQDLAPKVHLFRVKAPAIARKAKAGQFVVIRMDEKGERIPLTIADWNQEGGDITLVFMEVGASTMMLATLFEGDAIRDVVGPLGTPSEIENYGNVICVAGGVGVAPIIPITKALKQAGNNITAILGARSRNMLFWEERFKEYSDSFIVTTDDGSYGRHGLVTQPLKELLECEKIDRVVAIGPAIMMKSCAECTSPFGVKITVSLNSTMIDGTGMCGGCRVTIGGKTKFTCVDGPEFDGHLVEWGPLLARQRTYLEKESQALKDCKWRAFERNLTRTGG
jgi:ferredoxin--NADP+ reductase